MKILHLLSNWKWTERSEPAVDLACAQEQAGAEVVFVCEKTPKGIDRSVETEAIRKGLGRVVCLPIPKHLNILCLGRDIRRLQRLMRDFQPDIMHSHMPNAHLMGTLARGSALFPLSVRSLYDPSGPEPGWRTRYLFSRRTDGVVMLSGSARSAFVGRHRVSEENVLVAEPGVDLQRFDPQRSLSGDDHDLHVPDDRFVMGLVSRIRQARRPDIALEALALLRHDFPQIHLLVVGRGRGNAVQTLIEEPAKALGVSDNVTLVGYCLDDRLVAAYRRMNILIYPVPGTDKSCRTVREGLASGVPVLVSQEGFLPDLVEEGCTGYVRPLSATAFADAIRPMILDRQLQEKMRREARSHSEARFSLGKQAARVLQFYERLLEKQKKR